MREQARAVEENLRAAMSCYRQVSDPGETRLLGGVAVTSCGMNLSVFNSALLTAPAGREDLLAVIGHADDYFSRLHFGWSFWLCDDFLPREVYRECPELFRQYRLAKVSQPPGMLVERVTGEICWPRDIEVREVNSAERRLEFAHVSSEVFALPFVSALHAYGRPNVWSGAMRGWVAYRKKKAVSIVTTVVAGGSVGVYSLGTMAAHRYQGIGEALLRHALAETRTASGVERSVLQSTEGGMRLYSKIGYVPVTTFSVYTKEARSRS